MGLDKFKLVLDPGGANETTFEGVGNLSVETTGEYSFLINNAFPQVTAIARKLADTNAIDGSPLASPHLNIGAGQRLFEVNFDKWEGETGQSWGDITSEITDPTADEKLTYLEDTLANRSPDSLNPAHLEYSIYSSDASTIRDPIPVAATQFNPTVDWAETASASRMRLTLAETLDLSKVVDDVVGNMDTDLLAYSFTPAGEASPDLPVPVDTFVTNRRDQGQSLTRNALDDPGGSFSAPAGEVRREGQSPADRRIEAVWRGANAQTLAETFKTDIVEDADVQQIDVTAHQGSSELAGTYSLGETGIIEPLDPRAGDALWRFELRLAEG